MGGIMLHPVRLAASPDFNGLTEPTVRSCMIHQRTDINVMPTGYPEAT